MSRIHLYLVGVVSFGIILIFFIAGPFTSNFLDVNSVHGKHHNHNPNLIVSSSDGERKIDNQKIHVGDLGGENREDEQEEGEGEKNAHASTSKDKHQQNKGDNDEEQASSSSSTSSSNLPRFFHRTSRFRRDLMNKIHQPLLPKHIRQLYAGSVMPKFVYKKNRAGDKDDDAEALKYQKKCPQWLEKDSPSNVQFAVEFSRILRDKFPPEKGGALDGSGLHWFLDEGGLIGSSRAGSLRNADDDFDFFLLLPHLHQPCREGSLTCTPEEFNKFIHGFLMVFHDEGMCINKFSPDPKRFKSNGRLMYSFQLNRGGSSSTADAENCFQEKKPFAHMHLGIFNEEGQVCTNVWIPAHSTHAKDKLRLQDMLPVARCRAGPIDVPCPQNITGFLTVRNGGEYRKRSADGSCLIVKKKWGTARKKNAAKVLKALDDCGYNSIVDLLPAFESSDYTNC